MSRVTGDGRWRDVFGFDGPDEKGASCHSEIISSTLMLSCQSFSMTLTHFTVPMTRPKRIPAHVSLVSVAVSL